MGAYQCSNCGCGKSQVQWLRCIEEECRHAHLVPLSSLYITSRPVFCCQAVYVMSVVQLLACRALLHVEANHRGGDCTRGRVVVYG
jgi:hypothetical protein